MARLPWLSTTWATTLVMTLAALAAFPAATYANITYVSGTNAQGVTRLLANDRFPALYTGAFGDCMGGSSLLNVTAFDAAYYADNMTVLFHLTGTTNLRNESIMMYISVDAYGEDRFDLTFNPCDANIYSLCPMNASVPIYGEAIIPVSVSDVAGIPSIALVIPDFEGSATLRFFSNETRTQIGCFRAVMRNGVTFSQVESVAPVLGVFTLVAVMASFATAIYGVSIPAIRTHHAHSLSVLVVFEVFQSIFFSGALSLNWPSVCASWWSNFAWSAGMISTRQVQSSINAFIGNVGNSSQVGGAGSTPLNNNGGLQQQIYGRGIQSLSKNPYRSVQRGFDLADRIAKRATGNNVTGPDPGYSWAGDPVAPGIPLPGNWSGFSGTLSEVSVPASTAFMTGFIWFLILLASLIGAVAAFKWSLEGLASAKKIKHDRLALFRGRWVGFLRLTILRATFIAFPMMMTLSLYQFSIRGSTAPIAIAAIVFVIFLFGALGVAGYACFYRLRFGHYESSPDRLQFRGTRVMKMIPWVGATRASTLGGDAPKNSNGLPFFRVRYIDDDPERLSVHQDQPYNLRFGWLSARFRRTRWWFFAVWAGYQLIRACFVGGASAHQDVQVFGLLIVEIVAAIGIVWINPFEGTRNTALAVYMLSISKVATAGLSIAFLPRFNLDRILATVVGIVIIVIQGALAIGVLILIVLSAISSWFSLTRNREQFKPASWDGLRVKYFNHVATKAPDVPPPPPATPEAPKEPYFNVNAVRRAPKIEDEDVDVVPEMENPSASQYSLQGGKTSRANSTHSHYSGYGNVPYGARVHRMSWSSRDFSNWQQEDVNGGSPSKVASRHASGTYSSDTQISMVPLVRPQASASNLRSATPSREHQVRFADQRSPTPI